MAGIVSYGSYIPKNRIRLSEISNTWNKEGVDIEKSLGLTEKSVAGIDEDAATLAAEAAFQALTVGQIEPTKIEAITVGSESHPYAVKPTSTIVGEILGCGNNYLAADLEFACKAGTAGIQLVSGLIDSKRIKYGLVIGSDVAQARPADVLEYTAASAAGAIVLGQ
jgi:hydroxymethylglutaryl-CoA synthase